MLSFLGAFLYDPIMAATEQACLQDWRRALLADVTGRVLEIGAGTGANLAYYPATVSSLTLSEPDEFMRKQLLTKVQQTSCQSISVVAGSAEEIAADAGSFDVVVATLVCCSVHDPALALQEIQRVLVPGGRFIFLEHVAAAQGSGRRRWQNWFNPLWRKLAGNCHLNRNTEQAITAAGFEISNIKRESLRKAMPLVRPSIRGVAIKTV
jgi:ubiquinone/menaquinone biosynthesis C-methylase UbiE